jgi:hypothetical protein
MSSLLHARSLNPRKITPVHTEEEAGWIPEPVRNVGEEKNLLPLAGFKPLNVELATPTTLNRLLIVIKFVMMMMMMTMTTTKM